MKVMLMRHTSEEQFKGNDIPARSKLYGLVPCGLGTVWSESLTSYLNRLAGLHHVSGKLTEGLTNFALKDGNLH